MSNELSAVVGRRKKSKKAQRMLAPAAGLPQAGKAGRT